MPLNSENIGKDPNYDFSDFADWLFSLSGTDFVLIGTIAALLISNRLTSNQQNSIGNFLILTGEAILTFQAQEITRLGRYQNSNNLTLEDLNQKINFLYNEFLKNKKEP